MSKDPLEAWSNIDQNLRSARTTLQTAQSETDYHAIGILCRETIVSVGALLFRKRYVGTDINVSNTDSVEILAKYFNRKLKGAHNEALRSYFKATWNLSNAVVHGRNSTYTRAEICVEACAHLVLLARILYFKESAPPNKRFRLARSGSAEGRFVTAWFFAHFNLQPLAKENGFTLLGIMYSGPRIIVSALREENKDSQPKRYDIIIYRPYWWKWANRLMADALIDEILISLVTELDKEQFEKTGRPPV
ncbi:MAG: hypothetical protein ACHQQQ_13480 [Bacteroidota bacterium]